MNILAFAAQRQPDTLTAIAAGLLEELQAKYPHAKVEHHQFYTDEAINERGDQISVVVDEDYEFVNVHIWPEGVGVSGLYVDGPDPIPYEDPRLVELVLEQAERVLLVARTQRAVLGVSFLPLPK